MNKTQMNYHLMLKHLSNHFIQFLKLLLNYKNIFRDMTIPAGITSIPVNINTYELFYIWLTHKRNELFESLQLDYDNIICYTNINIPKITKKLKQLENP